MRESKRQQQARVAEARTYLEELDAGDVDDTSDALLAIEEFLEAIGPEHGEVRAELETARRELLGEAAPAKPKQTPKPKRAPRARGSAKAAAAPVRRKAPAGAVFAKDADRIGGEPPFELTYTYDGNVRRVSTLRAHMRLFSRLPTRGLLDEMGRLYEELLAALGPFGWLQKTTTRLYGAATPSALASARLRIACPPGSSCYITLKAAELADDVAERRLELHLHPRGSGGYTHCPSVLQLTLPPAAMDGAFRDRFLELCARVPQLLTGTAGHYLDLTGVDAAPALGARVMEVALAHPGLELPGDAMHAQFVGPSWISGVSWLTALGPGVQRTLGVDSLRAELDAPLVLHGAGEALVIQAGPAPELGGQGVAPASYARVFACLNRPSTLCGLVPELRSDRADEWNRRLMPKAAAVRP